MPTPDARRLTRPTRVSPKGQVTLPKPVRDYLGIAAGSAVEFELTGSGDVVLRKRPDSALPLRGLLAAYALDGPAPSTEALEAGIAREVARLDARSKSRTDRDTDDSDE